jgi:hypothetical protein
MKKAMPAFFFFLFYLCIIDVMINVLLGYPDNPPKSNFISLRRYFEYGRSIEGKYQRMVLKKNDPMMNIGWIENAEYSNLPSNKKIGKDLLVGVYGMSHTKCLAEAMAKLDTTLAIRPIGAPGAPLNWSFTEFQTDILRCKPDVVILGILAGGLPYITTTCGSSMAFDNCYPYTYPRYRIVNDSLTRVDPPYNSLGGFFEFYSDKSKWKEYRAFLSTNDNFYDPVLFNYTFIDQSAIIRIVRRAYAQYVRKSGESKILLKTGYKDNSEEILLLKRIIIDFQKTAQREGILPVLYLVNNPRCGDYLYQTLLPVLTQSKILYLSSHSICPPNRPEFFLQGDDHFIPSKDIELAKEMIKIIKNGRLAR